MKKLLMICSLVVLTLSARAGKPWENGKLKVSDNQRYLQFENGQPFFWQGETGWLLPERLDRAEAEWYLQCCREAGYNVVQIQVIDGVPAYNIYGQMSNIDGWNFKNINQKGVYGYWDHLDYIIDLANQNGIYIGMVCIWGGLVKDGKLVKAVIRSKLGGICKLRSNTPLKGKGLKKTQETNVYTLTTKANNEYILY